MVDLGQTCGDTSYTQGTGMGWTDMHNGCIQTGMGWTDMHNGCIQTGMGWTDMHNG